MRDDHIELNERSVPIVGRAADNAAGIQDGLRVYLEHENKSLLFRLSIECGYMSYRQVDRVPTRAMSQLIRDILEQSCTVTCEKDQLFRGHQLHIPKNLVRLNLPYLQRQGAPGHFGLDNWDQLLVNIAQRKIMPTTGYPRIGKPEVIQERLEQMNEDAPRRGQLGQTYALNTDVTAQELTNMLPIKAPTQYRDGRPEPGSAAWNSLDIKGPEYSFEYCWYIGNLPRQSRRLYIPDPEVAKLLALADHWHMVPLRTRNINVRMCLVIEAIAHNLLVPIETDTPANLTE